MASRETNNSLFIDPLRIHTDVTPDPVPKMLGNELDIFTILEERNVVTKRELCILIAQRRGLQSVSSGSVDVSLHRLRRRMPNSIWTNSTGNCICRRGYLSKEKLDESIRHKPEIDHDHGVVMVTTVSGKVRQYYIPPVEMGFLAVLTPEFQTGRELAEKLGLKHFKRKNRVSITAMRLKQRVGSMVSSKAKRGYRLNLLELHENSDDDNIIIAGVFVVNVKNGWVTSRGDKIGNFNPREVRILQTISQAEILSYGQLSELIKINVENAHSIISRLNRKAPGIVDVKDGQVSLSGFLDTEIISGLMLGEPEFDDQHRIIRITTSDRKYLFSLPPVLFLLAKALSVNYQSSIAICKQLEKNAGRITPEYLYYLESRLKKIMGKVIATKKGFGFRWNISVNNLDSENAVYFAGFILNTANGYLQRKGGKVFELSLAQLDRIWVIAEELAYNQLLRNQVEKICSATVNDEQIVELLIALKW